MLDVCVDHSFIDQVFKKGDRTVLLRLSTEMSPAYLALAVAENPKNVRKLAIKTLQR